MTASEVAKQCDVSRQTVQSWRREGLQRSPTIAQLLRFLAHREGYAPGSERERLAREQATRVALANARTRGELLLVGDVAEFEMAMVADLAGQLTALPGRVAGELAGYGGDPAAIRQRLLVEVNTIRANAASYCSRRADLSGRES